MKLYEMPRTVVHLKTQDEYDEYMKMCEKVGWRWSDFSRPTELNNFINYDECCVTIESNLLYCDLKFHENEGYTILTFDELLRKLNTKNKVEESPKFLEFKDIHLYLVYVLLKNGATPERCDGENTGIFHTDDFLIRVVGKTHDFEVQMGVRDTFDQWANSVDFYFDGLIDEDDKFRLVVICIEDRLKKAEELFKCIPTEYFDDPCLKIRV